MDEEAMTSFVRQMDVDGNGKISPEEFHAAAEAALARCESME